jgi:6-pyruvoyltetrahydropterin/6-carboxytetrahydropterin synthase
MYEVTVIEEFCAAHFLRGYEGKCESMHGHNYRVEFSIIGSDLDDIGMLYDFSEIRRELRETIEEWDHTVLNQIEPFGRVNPTAENIAREVCRIMVKKLDLKRVLSARCDVWETERSRASYMVGMSEA